MHWARTIHIFLPGIPEPGEGSSLPTTPAILSLRVTAFLITWPDASQPLLTVHHSTCHIDIYWQPLSSTWYKGTPAPTHNRLLRDPSEGLLVLLGCAHIEGPQNSQKQTEQAIGTSTTRKALRALAQPWMPCLALMTERSVSSAPQNSIYHPQ